MDFLLSLLIAGTCVGSVYALVAVGLNFTFWTTRTLNFGQGAIMMAGAISTAALSTSLGLGLWTSILLSIVLVAVIGFAVERLAIRPALKSMGSLTWVIATLGFGILLQGIAAKTFGSEAMPFPEIVFKTTDALTLGGHALSLQYLSVFVVSVVIIGVLELLMRRTVLGKAVRAVAQDAELAEVQGLPVKLIISASFVASGVVAGVAGILVAQIGGTIDPAFGFELVLFGFVAAVVGGMGNSPGALIAGIGTGILSKLIGGYVSTAAEHGIAFLVLVLMLALRPHGLFGRAEVAKA